MSKSAQSQRAGALNSLFRNYEGPVFAIRFWDGWRWASSDRSNPACTVVFHSESALQAMIAKPSEITLGEAFLKKEIDVEGDLFSVFELVEHVLQCPRSWRQRTMEIISGLGLGLRRWWERGTVHSQERDQSAISYHYDQPVDFYRAWLGESLVYSCAYFDSAFDEIEQAQADKLELICRKLRLQPGERFLDVGCGWGSLILHAASKHRVNAQGITISQQQATTAESRIRQSRMNNCCQADLLDYREAPHRFETFDKIASVGMFEHVGLKDLPTYFETIHKLLRPGGVFLNHGIARAPYQGMRDSSFVQEFVAPLLQDVLHLRKSRSTSFIDKYVFPDGELVTISQAMSAAEFAGFEVRDVENLREHYELTLRCWVKRLQDKSDELLRLVPEKTYRIWLLYMAGSAAAFRRGDIAVYQALLSKPEHGSSKLPLRRNDWYIHEFRNVKHVQASYEWLRNRGQVSRIPENAKRTQDKRF